MAVSYWDLTKYNANGLAPNTGKLFAYSFSQSRSDGKYVINGWQDWYDYAGGYSVQYDVDQVLSNGSDTSVSSTTIPGTYAENGTWYNVAMYNVPYGQTFEMEIMNNSPTYYVQGAGNGYE